MSRKMTIVLVFVFTCLSLQAQQNILLYLKLNNQPKATVYRDEPLLLTLSISNPKASEDEQWNRSANYRAGELDKAYHDHEISEEEWKDEKQKLDKVKKTSELVRLGSTAQPVWE